MDSDKSFEVISFTKKGDLLEMSTTAINVKFVDNELYIIAIPSNGMASSELFHYMSGFNDPMNVTIIPKHVLAAGTYTLCFVGINWGGPSQFSISLTGGPAVILNAISGAGCVCTSVPITV